MRSVNCICESCRQIVPVKEDVRECPNCHAKLKKTNQIKTKTKLRDKAWRTFSQYIRMRDCIKTTGNQSHGVCYTCGELFEIKKLQAGHMISGRTYDILFDERLVNAQCYKCNMHKNGEQGIFNLKKIDELVKNGYSLQEAFDEVKSWHSKEKRVLNQEDLVKIYFEYKDKLEGLERETNHD